MQVGSIDLLLDPCGHMSGWFMCILGGHSVHQGSAGFDEKLKYIFSPTPPRGGENVSQIHFLQPPTGTFSPRRHGTAEGSTACTPNNAPHPLLAEEPSKKGLKRPPCFEEQSRSIVQIPKRRSAFFSVAHLIHHCSWHVLTTHNCILDALSTFFFARIPAWQATKPLNRNT